jgi:MFS superfamily sulfate permease-like transporter
MLVAMSAGLVDVVLTLLSAGSRALLVTVPCSVLAVWVLAVAIVILIRRLRANDRHYFPPRANSWGEHLAYTLTGLPVAVVFLLAGFLLLVEQRSTPFGRALGILLVVGTAAVIWINARHLPRAYRLWHAHASYPSTWKELANQLRHRETYPT